MPNVIQHRFEGSTQTSTERIRLANGTELTVEQSGCDQLTQLFQFELPIDTLSLRSRTIGVFRMMGTQHPDLTTFGLFANAMDDVLPPEVVRNQPYELQPGMNFSVDELTSSEKQVLRVRFTN